MEENNYEREIYTLKDENGEEFEFEVIGHYEHEGEHYVALIFAEDEESDEPADLEYTILKLEGAEDDEDQSFVTVDDDDEFEAVAAYFDDLFSQEIDYD